MANHSSPDPFDTGIYMYKPNITAAFIAAGLFGVSGMLHLWTMCRKRSWFYSPLVVGALMMSAGYGFRIPSAKSPRDIMFYILQSLFIILPPSLYAATIYMIFGRIILFVRTPTASIIAPNRITKIFVVGDVIAFFLQAGGGGMMAQEGMADIGQKVVLGGLFIQILFFVFFLTTAIVFWVRMHSSTTYGAAPSGKTSWKSLFKLLLFASAIIILRCVFRIVEFGQGHDGNLASKEVYMYCFDTIPMWVVQIAFHFVHAGDTLIGGEVGFTKAYSESDIALHQAA